MIVQELYFYYYKETRGGSFDKQRYDFTYELPEKLFNSPQGYSDKKVQDLFVLSSFFCIKDGFSHNYTGLIDPSGMVFRWVYISGHDVVYKYSLRWDFRGNINPGQIIIQTVT